jgi:hypothetical protein
MGALADAYALLEKGTLWSSNGRCKGYAVSDPREAAQIDAYIAALDAGQAPAPPQLATYTGRGLVGMLAALVARTAPAPPPAPAPAPAPAAVLFEDDFSGPLDPTVWDVKNRTNDYSGTTYQPGNVTVKDGQLVITAYKDAAGKWYGGEIQLLAAHAYTGPHYIECVATLPAGAGVWSGPLWERDAPWGALGIENDVCEQLGKEPSVFHATVHNGPSESYSVPITVGAPIAGGVAHRYGCAMYADHADYFFDGAKVASIPASTLTAWKFTTTPLVCLLDLDMGGAWAGTPTIPGPVSMLVDYVRVTAL